MPLLSIPPRLLGVPLALAALIAAAGGAFLSFRETRLNTESLQRLWQRLGKIQTLEQSLTDAETDQRAYFLTQDPRHLDSCTGSVQSAQSALASLHSEPEVWALLQGPAGRKLASLEGAIQNFRVGRTSRGPAPFRPEEGLRLMEDVRAQAALARQQAMGEQSHLNLRLQTLAHRTFLSVSAALAMGLIALPFAFMERQQFLRAQRALTWQESRFRNLADHAPVGIFEISLAGVPHYSNAALRALFGFPEGSPITG